MQSSESKNTRGVAKMKMEGTCPTGGPRLKWKDTVRRDLKVWNMNELGQVEGTNAKVYARPVTPLSMHRDTAMKYEKMRNDLHKFG